jgi:hypothetical protein
MEGKNCDKLITPTIRVSCWAHFKTVTIVGFVTLRNHLKVPENCTELSRFTNLPIGEKFLIHYVKTSLFSIKKLELLYLWGLVYVISVLEVFLELVMVWKAYYMYHGVSCRANFEIVLVF